MDFLFSAISLLLILQFPLYSQTKLDFADFEINTNIDFCSYYPQVLLKHEIEEFQKLPKNPVLTPSYYGWDSKDVADPFIHVTADSIYLFYDGSSNGRYSIGYATRDSLGWGWVKRKKILTSDNVEWRSFHLIAPTLIPNSKMLLYNGNKNDSELGYKIGLAQKLSLWQFQSVNPVLKSDSQDWDFSGNAYQDIIYNPIQKKYFMWYSGFSGPLASIGKAESNDGLTWSKSQQSPVLQNPPGVIAPEVVFNGEGYVMFYTQLDFRSGFYTYIKSAKSLDGNNWSKETDLLKPESRWEGKRLMRPNISFFEQQVHLFYCAQRGSTWRIGEAIANSRFEKNGYWLSKPLKKAFNEIFIDYEQPDQTILEINLLNSQNKLLADLKQSPKTKLRTNVYRIKIHTKIQTGNKIEIKMQTENPNLSPVIFNIELH